MPQLLALLGAAFYGVADFSGGLATRSTSAWRITAWSQLIGVPLLIVGIAVFSPSDATPTDLALGVAAGAIGLVGIVMLYSALASGTMSVVAPIVGALAAAIPVAWDVAFGASITPVQWLGIAVALTSVALLAIQSGTNRTGPAPILKAIGAAASFAAFFVLMSYTNAESGLWPLVAARSATIPIAFVAAAAFGTCSLPSGSLLRLVAYAGLADMAANLAILTALQRGPLSLVAVLSSLYPAFTVVTALIVLREHPTRRQQVGILLAILAAAILAA